MHNQEYQLPVLCGSTMKRRPRWRLNRRSAEDGRCCPRSPRLLLKVRFVRPRGKTPRSTLSTSRRSRRSARPSGRNRRGRGVRRCLTPALLGRQISSGPDALVRWPRVLLGWGTADAALAPGRWRTSRARLTLVLLEDARACRSRPSFSAAGLAARAEAYRAGAIARLRRSLRSNGACTCSRAVSKAQNVTSPRRLRLGRSRGHPPRRHMAVGGVASGSSRRLGSRVGGGREEEMIDRRRRTRWPVGSVGLVVRAPVQTGRN